jgi:hypothetical protein
MLSNLYSIEAQLFAIIDGSEQLLNKALLNSDINYHKINRPNPLAPIADRGNY